MSGLLEKILTKRYGSPTRRKGQFAECWWGRESEELSSVLYVGMDWNNQDFDHLRAHEFVYGPAIGGFLVGQSLKVAMLSKHEVFGLYGIEELQQEPEILTAQKLDADIHFFMDASNIWFYGHKAGQLFVYDGETLELDCLGSIESAIEELLEEWEESS